MSVNFTPENSQVNIPWHVDFSFGTGEFFISFWLKTTQNPPSSLVSILTSNNNRPWGVFLAPGGTIKFFGTPSHLSAATSNSANDGDWNQIAVGRIVTTLKIYINNQEGLSDPNWSDNLTFTPTSLLFGDDKQRPTDPQWSINEIAIWKGAFLTAAERERNFKRKIKGTSRGIQPAFRVGAWLMNDFGPGVAMSGANTVIDESGGSHHGTPAASPLGLGEDFLSYIGSVARILGGVTAPPVVPEEPWKEQQAVVTDYKGQGGAVTNYSGQNPAGGAWKDTSES